MQFEIPVQKTFFHKLVPRDRYFFFEIYTFL